MSDPLLIAIPSKGRLQDNTTRFFAESGLDLVQGRGTRDYRGTLAGIEGVEVVFLPVAEIVGRLAEGLVRLGVAGEDLLREQTPDADRCVTLLTPLGFGHANVVVAVPQAWIDVRTTVDLEDVAAIFHARHGRRMRVATKYTHLTRAFFADHGVTDYRIVESLGATEGAPASGSAELIVDITTTGATLAANALKVLDDGIILRSEASLDTRATFDSSPFAGADRGPRKGAKQPGGARDVCRPAGGRDRGGGCNLSGYSSPVGCSGIGFATVRVDGCRRAG